MKVGLKTIRKILFLDKRKNDRISLPVTVLYSWSPAEAHAPKWIKPHELIDVSGHGLKMKTVAPIPQGASIDLRIEFADHSPSIMFAAEVVWCQEIFKEGGFWGDTRKRSDGYSIGLKFHKMNHADRRRFVTYVCENIIDTCLDDEGNIKA